MKRLASAVWVAASGWPAWAAGGTGGGSLAYTPPSTAPGPTATDLVVRLVVMTAGVLVGCGVLIWVTRRWLGGSAPVDKPADRLRHEASLPLDHRAAVHLIRVDGHTVAATTDGTGLRSLVLLAPPFAGFLADDADD